MSGTLDAKRESIANLKMGYLCNENLKNNFW